MLLKTVISQIWTFYTPCDDDGISDLFEFIECADRSLEADVAGLLAKLDTISASPLGPKVLNQKICHYVDDRERIFQVRHGQLRLLMFYSLYERKVIICSSPFIKDTQKTPRSEIAKAVSIKTSYQAAAANKQVSIIPEEQEGA